MSYFTNFQFCDREQKNVANVRNFVWTARYGRIVIIKTEDHIRNTDKNICVIMRKHWDLDSMFESWWKVVGEADKCDRGKWCMTSLQFICKWWNCDSFVIAVEFGRFVHKCLKLLHVASVNSSRTMNYSSCNGPVYDIPATIECGMLQRFAVHVNARNLSRYARTPPSDVILLWIEFQLVASADLAPLQRHWQPCEWLRVTTPLPAASDVSTTDAQSSSLQQHLNHSEKKLFSKVVAFLL